MAIFFFFVNTNRNRRFCCVGQQRRINPQNVFAARKIDLFSSISFFFFYIWLKFYINLMRAFAVALFVCVAIWQPVDLFGLAELINVNVVGWFRCKRLSYIFSFNHIEWRQIRILLIFKWKKKRKWHDQFRYKSY